MILSDEEQPRTCTLLHETTSATESVIPAATNTYITHILTYWAFFLPISSFINTPDFLVSMKSTSFPGKSPSLSRLKTLSAFFKPTEYTTWTKNKSLWPIRRWLHVQHCRKDALKKVAVRELSKSIQKYLGPDARLLSASFVLSASSTWV